jgi:prepilin-type N-terminal cleavage/methylation domain-containing protein/prepilin-type processing-associated H-X9-DG protein
MQGSSDNGDRAIRRGFTLIEVLVVIGIIAVLIAILVPVVSSARRSANITVCASNLHQIGQAIFTYSYNNNGYIPYGPKAPAFSATNFYPRTGNVTSLISLENGKTVGLGLMLNKELSNNPRVLFCPATDQDYLADYELSMVGKTQAQCDYYYRHASGSSLFTDATTDHLKLARLGKNSNGDPIRALVMDVNFLTVSGLAAFGGYTRTCHNRQSVNVLFSDGHVSPLDNRRDTYTVDATTNVQDSFAKILKVFETADLQ